MQIKYSDILKQNIINDERFKCLKHYELFILSNVTVNQLNDILKYCLRSEGISISINNGDYDNIIQDSWNAKNAQIVVVFWNIDNIIDGLYYKVNLMTQDQIEQIIKKVEQELDIIFENLNTVPLVVFNKFSDILTRTMSVEDSKLRRIAFSLNKILEEKAPKNFSIIDTDLIIEHLSVGKSIDWRFYYSSKAPYTIDFFWYYCQMVKPLISSLSGKAKKALIFDCDNTLWKGVLGEAGINGIQMSSKDKIGAIYQEIQYIAKDLSKRGIIIGLCSKNNPEEVDDVIRNHPDMILRETDIIIKKVNWLDKVTNLKSIARELNIGLDSLVFVDDSSFEINLIREHLPEVVTFQVPEKIYLYPRMLRDSMRLFYNHSVSQEDKLRLQMYKTESLRLQEKDSFDNIDDYLGGLQLQVTASINDQENISRIAQLTQKTNQFNLTTKRYTDQDIINLINSKRAFVFSFNVSDKFGCYGLTAVSIIKLDKSFADIDTFLMSCRIIGRKIEYTILDYIIRYLSAQNIVKVSAEYIKTMKNDQVSCWWEKCGFKVLSVDESKKCYEITIDDYLYKSPKFIKINKG